MDWEAILRDDGPAVWRTANRLLGNRADADECFQETFVAAVELHRRSTEPVRNWRAMLVRLTTARAIDRLRQRVRRSSREVGGDHVDRLPDPDPLSRPADRAEQAETSARLRSIIAHLPPNQADAFCLHCLEGWSYREIAEHLETSVDNIGVLVHRARADLKERLKSLRPSEARSGAETRRLSTSSEIDEVSS